MNKLQEWIKRKLELEGIIAKKREEIAPYMKEKRQLTYNINLYKWREKKKLNNK